MSELAKSLAEWQAGNPAAAMSGKNPHFKSRFSTLQDIVDCARSATAHGICFTQEVDFETDNERPHLYVRTVMHHVSGEKRESRCPIITREASDPQKMGSAITYAKRYGLQAIFGIPADEDDDGNKANEAPKRVTPRPASAPSAGASSPPAEVPLEQELAMAKDQKALLALFNRVKPTDPQTIKLFSDRKGELSG